MKLIDYLIVSQKATMGQKIYSEQRKKMLDDLCYSSEIINYSSTDIFSGSGTYFALRCALAYKKIVNKYLNNTKPKVIEFCGPITIILQNNSTLKNYKTIVSFDLPLGINMKTVGSDLLHRLERKKFHDVDLIFSLTKHGKEFVEKEYKIIGKATQMPFAFDINEINKYQISNKGYAMAYSSSDISENAMMYKKGLDILVKTWEHIQRKLIITGIDKNAASRFLKSQNIKIPENIEFAGKLKREDYLNLLSGCDFFISSSRWEDFGQTVIEAFAFSKPVIATPTIGPSESIKEIDNKLISPSFSPLDLLKTIQYVEKHVDDGKIISNIKKIANKYEYSIVKDNFKKYLEVIT